MKTRMLFKRMKCLQTNMQAVHTLLAKQFPHLDSLQSPLLVQNGSFQPIACDGGYSSEGLSSTALQVLQYCHKVNLLLQLCRSFMFLSANTV